MKFRFLVGSTCVAISAFALANAARAGDVVNTGPGPGTTPGWSLGNGVQSLAGEFTLTSTQQVSAIYGWIGDDYVPEPNNNTPGENDTGGVLDVTLFSGDINLGNAIYSGSTLITLGTPPSWLGTSGLNLSLNAGDYWVEFSGDVPYDSPGGLLAYMPFSVPNPLEGYDYNDSGSPTGFSPYPLSFGVQIVGSGNSVPDSSSSALLLGCSMVVLAMAAGRRRLAA